MPVLATPSPFPNAMAVLVYSKHVVLQGYGVRHPSEFSSVTVNICSKYVTQDDTECVFDQEDNTTRQLGELMLW